MKKKFIIAGMLFLPFTVQANEVCYNWSESAEKLAEHRYNGVSMRDMMEGAQGNPIVEATVMDLYDLPDWQSEEMQEMEIRQFADDIFKACLDHFED